MTDSFKVVEEEEQEELQLKTTSKKKGCVCGSDGCTGLKRRHKCSCCSQYRNCQQVYRQLKSNKKWKKGTCVDCRRRVSNSMREHYKDVHVAEKHRTYMREIISPINNPINNPINSPIYNPICNEKRRRRRSQELKEAMAEREDVDVPRFTCAQLGELVLQRLGKHSEALSQSTLLYVYTTSKPKALNDKEAYTVFNSAKGQASNSSPPLQRAGDQDLRSADIKSLKFNIIDFFGWDDNEGYNHLAVAEVEALLHIRLWKLKGRAWRKVGGDHAAGRKRIDGLVDVSPRVVRILYTSSPLDPLKYVWNADRHRACTQRWEVRVSNPMTL